DRWRRPALLQSAQQIHTARARHRDVEQTTSSGFALQSQQELTGAAIADRTVTADAQDAQHAGAKTDIVIDDVNRRLGSHILIGLRPGRASSDPLCTSS